MQNLQISHCSSEESKIIEKLVTHYSDVFMLRAMTCRVCVDFRKINNVTENQTFPMPDLDEELSKMIGARIFSTLDIYSAFHQIKLRERERQ